jgi:hypothetical protein
MTNIKEGYDSCRFLLKLLLKEQVAINPIVTEYNGWFVIDLVGLDPEEATYNIEILVFGISFIFLPSTRMLIAGRSAGKLICSGFGML